MCDIDEAVEAKVIQNLTVCKNLKLVAFLKYKIFSKVKKEINFEENMVFLYKFTFLSSTIWIITTASLT